jgi:rod shape-determining protein MreB
MGFFDVSPYFQRAIYVRIGRESLTVRDARTGKELKEPPLAAIAQGAAKTLLAIGTEAASLGGRDGVVVVNPFAHPRTPLSDFTTAEALIKAMIRKLDGGRWWLPNPAIVMHLDYPVEGGLTQIEVRALKELGIGAGALHSTVWQGPVLSDEQVLAGKFPATGIILE